jgi:CheY-like chemotaxis protein
VRTRAHPGAIRIEIEDSGPGIPIGSLERIFNPFYTTKPTGQGTGLGLSISLGIVSEHGGRIWAENVIGGGSRFVVEIPQTAAPRRSGEERAAPEPSAPGKLRVLVVDDEEPLRMALEMWLKRGGHDVVTTASGLEAMALAVRDRFDTLLLDIRMPDLSGEQIFTRLSREAPEAARRIIFLTGDIVSVELRRFLEDSGQPFFAKPFDFAEIARALPRARG